VTREVITAIGGPWETELVTALEATAGYTLVRRCADLPELLSVAAAGFADVALVSADLRSLDRPALAELATHGVLVAGVVAAGDDHGERHLRQLGLGVVVRADLASSDLDDALDALGHPSASHASSAVQAGAGRPTSRSPGHGAGSQVIAVWGATGAPGRSTVALNLSAELAEVGPTLLVDCDTYGASQSQALGLLDEAPGIAAAARAADQGNLDVHALARVAPEVSRGLRVLTGLPRADRWTELRAASVTHVLAVARELATFVVVDCGFSLEDDEELSYDTLAPRRNAATLSAIEAADHLLVVGSADPVGLQRLVRAVQDSVDLHVGARRVVVNRVRAAAVGSHPRRRITEALSRFAGLEDLAFLPDAQEVLDSAMLAGQTLREHAPECELRTALADLAQHYAGTAPLRRRRGRSVRR
jgi:MinD-like ATPase involved in chromosome partitioning or flagellar assembly